MSAASRRSPLHERHAALGAKFAAFGGWEMPLDYAGGGVLKEHAAVRESVGVFDVSHLGKVSVRGAGAVAFLNSCLTNDLNKITSGQAQYTLCCDPSGGVVDDLIAYVHTPEHVLLIPNAANSAEVVRRLRAQAPPEIGVSDDHEAFAVLAVQGPRSAWTLERLGLPTQHTYMSFAETQLDGVALTVCRTGYTGEHGYELVVASHQVATVWDALLTAGAPEGIRACGLGARDTLRTEMGYPLHGQDLSIDITPVQARLGWAVGWSKPEFWGRSALVAERARGPRRLLWGLQAMDRGIPRSHMHVLLGDRDIGEITSGTFSPTKRVGIALALLDTGSGGAGDGEAVVDGPVVESGVVEGGVVEVDVRGRRSPMRVVKPPFVTTSVR